MGRNDEGPESTEGSNLSADLNRRGELFEVALKRIVELGGPPLQVVGGDCPKVVSDFGFVKAYTDWFECVRRGAPAFTI